MSEWVYVHRIRLSNAADALHTTWKVLLVMSTGLIFAGDWGPRVIFILAGATVISQVVFRGCPLVVLEEVLLNYGKPSGQCTYRDEFIVRFMRRLTDATPAKVLIVTVAWLLFVAITAALIIFRYA